ncbi:MCP four helix bundle domain-containing protein [Rahnella sp. L151-1A]|nr:methyl-accepting chemotaxis protein [Rahnella perminowiae]MBU9826839.1 MCP four helix bundle domain-containing protein [Rahnella perminowiae]
MIHLPEGNILTFNNIKIGVRLGLVFGFIITLLIIVSITAFVKINAINALTQQMIEVRYEKVRLAFDVRFQVNEQIKFLRGAVIDYARPEYNNQRLQSLNNASSATQQLIAKITALQTTSIGQQKIKVLAQANEEYRDAQKGLFALLKAGKREEAENYVLRSMRAPEAAMLKSTADFADSQASQMKEEGRQILHESAMAIRITLLISLMAIISSIILGYLLTRSITRPMMHAIRIAENVAKGDLTSEIQVNSTDETGQMMLALQNMNNNLRKIVSEVRSGTDTIATASQQISMGTLDLASRTEQQASSLEETASAMEQMTSTVKQNADNAHQANNLSKSASRVATESADVVSQVVVTMDMINDASKKIVDIISVIDRIAFQTNILALNAAVEAARAGTQGRGFAVVATEVRGLAHSSATAAREIKSLIEESVTRVDEGTRLVAQAGSTISNVVSSVSNVTGIMGEISIASVEQSTGIGQINAAINQMDSVTQQNASLVQEASSAAQSLEDQAVRLVKAVSMFKL